MSTVRSVELFIFSGRYPDGTPGRVPTSLPDGGNRDDTVLEGVVTFWALLSLECSGAEGYYKPLCTLAFAQNYNLLPNHQLSLQWGMML